MALLVFHLEYSPLCAPQRVDRIERVLSSLVSCWGEQPDVQSWARAFWKCYWGLRSTTLWKYLLSTVMDWRVLLFFVRLAAFLAQSRARSSRYFFCRGNIFSNWLWRRPSPINVELQQCPMGVLWAFWRKGWRFRCIWGRVALLLTRR